MVIDNSDPRRDALHEFMQGQGPPSDDDEDLAGRAAVLTGWVIVQEWMDETGERWLARANSASFARWHANALLHEALYGDWGERGPDEH